VYEQQKELLLIGERLVLVTLGFDMNMHRPYKPFWLKQLNFLRLLNMHLLKLPRILLTMGMLTLRLSLQK
jgi:hypothetical protein